MSLQEQYRLLVSDKVVQKGLKMIELVLPEYIWESSTSCAVIVPRLEDPTTFRVPRIEYDTGDFMCSCERWIFHSQPCSHLITALEVLSHKHDEKFISAVIYKMTEKALEYAEGRSYTNSFRESEQTSDSR